MQCSPSRETAWNLLSLFTTSGLLYLEISLVAFILQGNYINGLEALSRTFLVTGVIVGADILLKVRQTVLCVANYPLKSCDRF